MPGQKNTGVTTLVSEISCVVDHAKLPNLVTVTFGEKLEPFDHWKEDSVMKLNVNGSISRLLYSRKPSITLKIVQRPDGRSGGKKTFY